MYQDLVVLLPGFLGFGHFGGFYYFADRVASTLRGALELEARQALPVIPISTLPTGALPLRQEFLLTTLTQLDAELGGVSRFHLVGHSTGGVDAFLLTQDRPFGVTPFDPRAVRRKLRSVTTLSAPHYGTGLASSDLAQFLSNPLSHMAGLPTVGKTIVDVLRSAPSEPSIPTLVSGALQDWRQSFAFLGQVLQHRELIQALRPERMAELMARCKPDPEVSAQLTCFATATASPAHDTVNSDPLYRDLYALTVQGITALGPVPRAALTFLEDVRADRMIKSEESTPLLSMDASTNDGIVTTACQLVHPDRPDEFGGLVVGDHGDALGHYPRVDIVTTLGGVGQEAKKNINGGLFHSGASFRDDQFFELMRRIARRILAAREAS